MSVTILVYATRSGGVSQPWHAESVANALHCHLRTCVSASKDRFLAGKRSHCTKSGGRKPPVGCTRYANSKRGNPMYCNCRRGLQTHGGLTPAALENVRLFIAKTVSFERMLVVPAPRAGGRKPPVVSLHAMPTVIGPHTVGGFPSNRPRVCVNVSAEPRRAHARRSCERAFVQRECRFSLRTNVVQPGAAGVSQPWETNSGASALHYPGGLTPAALAKVRLCTANVVFLAAKADGKREGRFLPPNQFTKRRSGVRQRNGRWPG
jgi:hypothetical protein